MAGCSSSFCFACYFHLIGPWWRIPEKERFCRAVCTTYKGNICGKGHKQIIYDWQNIQLSVAIY